MKRKMRTALLWNECHSLEKWGCMCCLHLELHITTFITHNCGLFQYKCLMFRTRLAPAEEYQYVIQQALSQVTARNVKLWGQNCARENRRRAWETYRASLRKNIKIISHEMRKRASFTWPSYSFTQLTNKGTGTTEEKLKAAVEIWENRADRILGLPAWNFIVNYIATFIPDFATVTGLLQRLTKKGVQMQRRSLSELSRADE